MEHQGLKVNCPICRGTLWIDPASGEVLYHERAKSDHTATFDDFLAKSDKQDQILDDKFAQVREREKSKMERLQKKFDWAKEHKDELPDPKKPLI
jgi:hypothetical protein